MTDPQDPGTPTPESPQAPPPPQAPPVYSSVPPASQEPPRPDVPPAGQAAPPYDPPPPSSTPIVSWDAPQEVVGPAPGVKFASPGVRLVAYIVDGLIVGFVFTAIFLIFGAAIFAGAGLSNFRDFQDLGPDDFRNGAFTPAMAAAFAAFGVFFLLALIVTLAYFPFFWARSGQTPGMRLFGLYVVRDSDGGKISGGQAILRLIGMWISMIPFYLGFIWIFIDARRRGWHDLIAGTVMIERAR